MNPKTYGIITLLVGIIPVVVLLAIEFITG